MTRVRGFLFVIAIDTLISIFNGWVFSWLWAWFVAAKFGLPVLSLAEAIGVAITAEMLISRTPHLYVGSQPSFEDKALHSFSYRITAGAMFLVIGYIVKGFL